MNDIRTSTMKIASSWQRASAESADRARYFLFLAIELKNDRAAHIHNLDRAAWNQGEAAYQHREVAMRLDALIPDPEF